MCWRVYMCVKLNFFYFVCCLFCFFVVLFQAAKGYGYVLLSRSSREVTISTPHRGLVRYQVLHVLEFDSERKCMSVIVREAGCRDSKTILYCKGADSAIYRKLAHHSGLLPSQYHQTEFAEEGEGEEEREGEGEGEEEVCGNLANRTQGHLNLYARLGLRTLCLARRVRRQLFSLKPSPFMWRVQLQCRLRKGAGFEAIVTVRHTHTHTHTGPE